MNLATSLTILRIVMSPLFLVIYLYHAHLGISAMALPFVLLLLMSVSELSDAMDGFIARRYNHVTDFGKLLDPMADTISRLSVFLAFTMPPVNLPLLLIVLFLYRDSTVSTLRTVCALNGFALAARTSGKVKAILQAAVIFMILGLMIPHAMGTLSTEALQEISFWLAATAGIYSLLSGIEYLIANRQSIKRILTPTPN